MQYSDITDMYVQEENTKFLRLCIITFQILFIIEWGELGYWCELGQKFSESSRMQLLCKH